MLDIGNDYRLYDGIGIGELLYWGEIEELYDVV